MNIENIGEFGKYWKSCFNIENHGDYLWIPKIMANIENHGNYFWKLKIRVNTETHGKYLQLSFWQSRSMSLLEMYTDPQVFEIGGILTLFTFTSNLNMFVLLALNHILNLDLKCIWNIKRSSGGISKDFIPSESNQGEGGGGETWNLNMVVNLDLKCIWNIKISFHLNQIRGRVEVARGAETLISPSTTTSPHKPSNSRLFRFV